MAAGLLVPVPSSAGWHRLTAYWLGVESYVLYRSKLSGAPLAGAWSERLSSPQLALNFFLADALDMALLNRFLLIGNRSYLSWFRVRNLQLMTNGKVRFFLNAARRFKRGPISKLIGYPQGIRSSSLGAHFRSHFQQQGRQGRHRYLP